MKRLKTSSELPKTAAPPPELFVNIFKRLVPAGEPILCVHPSAEVSGTVRSATVAARDFPDAQIHIVDTRTIASPLGEMVQMAAEWAEEGNNIETILKRLDDWISRCKIYFLVSTLEYLARGGRIGGAAALMGSVLQIKPILTMKEGQVDQYERERTHKRALARLKHIIIEQAPKDGTAHLSVLHAGTPEQANLLAAELQQSINQAYVRVADMPPAIVTHAGPGVLGVGFFTTQANI